MTRRFAVLIGVHPDTELARGTRGFEHAESGGAGGVEDHVHALIVHRQRHLFAASRIAECFGRDTGVVHDHLAIGADMLHAGAIARFELVNERDVHATHEAHLLGVPYERGQRAHEKRALLLAEFERDEVWGHRQRITHAVSGHGVIDIGEADVRILLRQHRDVVGKDETDGHHEVHSLGGQQSQAGFAVRAFTRLDVAHPCPQRLRRAEAAQVGAIVERLVAATAHVKDDPDVQTLGGVGDRCPRGVDGEEGGVGEEERPDEVKGPAHGPEASPYGAVAGRGNGLQRRRTRIG